MEAKQKEIKELTVKGLEPEIARLIARHKQVSFLRSSRMTSISSFIDYMTIVHFFRYNQVIF